jgi:hypothetical protein
MAVMACAVSAQQITEFRQPGDVIRLEIKFDGADAPKIKTISLYLNAQTNPSDDQAGFMNWAQTQQFGATSPGKFLVEMKIPGTVMTLGGHPKPASEGHLKTGQL